jgi:hypothetical protein
MDTVHLTRYTGQKAIEFIRQAPQEKPFMLSLSFSAPHAHDPAEEQYFWEKEFDSLYASQHFPGPLLSDQEYFEAQPPMFGKVKTVTVGIGDSTPRKNTKEV